MKLVKNLVSVFLLNLAFVCSSLCMDKNASDILDLTDKALDRLENKLNQEIVTQLAIDIKANLENIEQALKLIDEALPKITDINIKLNVPMPNTSPIQVKILELAFIWKKSAIIKKLWQVGARCNYEELVRGLRIAAKTGDIALAQVLFEIDPQLLEESFIIADVAGEKGHFEFVQMLMDRKADLQGQTLLHFAAYYGFMDAVKKFANDQTIKAVDKYGRSALEFAAMQNKFDVVDYLMQMGAPTNGNTALHYASRYAHLDAMQACIKRGDNVNTQNKVGFTPLLYAMDLLFNNDANLKIEKLKSVIQLLIKAKASLTIKTTAKYDALIIAGIRGYTQLGEFLLEQEPNGLDTYIAAEQAASKGHFDFIKMLIQKGANLKDQTLLHYAAFYGKSELVKQLVEKNYDINQKDKNSRSPLDNAAIAKHFDVVEFFIRHLIATHNMFGNQPLHLAAQYTHLGLVEEFIAKGHDVNERNAQGNTPIMCAIASNFDIETRKQIIVRLKKAQARFTITDTNNEGRSTLSLAVDRADAAMLNFLLEQFPDDFDKLQQIQSILEKFPAATNQTCDMTWKVNPWLADEKIKANLFTMKIALETELARLLEPLKQDQITGKISPSVEKKKSKAQKRLQQEQEAKKKREQEAKEEQERIKEEEARRAANKARKARKKAKQAEKAKQEQQASQETAKTSAIEASQITIQAIAGQAPEVEVDAPSPRNSASLLADNQSPKLLGSQKDDTVPAQNNTQAQTLQVAQPKEKASQIKRNAKKAAQRAEKLPLIQKAHAYNNKRLLKNTFNAWKMAIAQQKIEKALMLAQKEAEKFRAKKLQQKVVNYWKQRVAYKKNQRNILESLKPTEQELASMLRAVAEFDLNNARRELTAYENQQGQMLISSQKIDQATFIKQYNDLDLKIQKLQKYIGDLEKL